MPPFDWIVSLAGFGVGIVVGLTGMGGGALMTPILVLLFGIPAHIAVGSDLTASLFMKPLGAYVHARRGTVHRGLVGWLCLGSVPASFAGAALVNHLGHVDGLESMIRRVLGITLLVAAAAMLGKWTLSRRRSTPNVSLLPIRVKPLQTVLLGVAGGFIVGMTSVGSGSLLIVMLMLLYPALGGSRLVGTDLAQAIPLVGAAALGHLVFGHIHLDLTGALLLGSIPGVYLGARFSSRAPDHVIRPALVTTLVASSIKLLGGSNQILGAVIATLAAGFTAYALATREAAEPVLETDETPEPTTQA
ncbi:MAG TPA: sulfite exporter TauE/SafE family protein [Polyangiaceae bacterium]|nr:sulfite exporter TauE/SafE family protein [Polyangiaceae bacterium]